MDLHSRGACPGIVPPYLLQHLLASGDADLADHARRTLQHDSVLRSRAARPTAEQTAAATKALRRTIHDAHHGSTLPGTVVRAEGDQPTSDDAVNQAYDALGDTWRLYEEVFGRNSIDGKGLPLVASVHYERNYDNAFWNGAQMVFGDGDGTIFLGFTRSVDVIGHELTHGVTESTAALAYQGQSGALNESISDVFGSLVKQRTLGQTADEADWLIGADLLAPGVKGVALRSMKAPGTAYDDPRLGKDPQPADMSGYVDTTDDNGGVHTNSGIPNRAFYLVAAAIGGRAWEAPGQIWYDVLTGSDIRPDCDFATFAGLTVAAATTRYGAKSEEAAAVADAWKTVGVVSHPAAGPGDTTGPSKNPAHADLTLRRTGGFGGLRQERTLALADLSDDDAAHWRSLLADDRLARLADAPTHPDAFSYSVRCEAFRVDVTIPEPALEPEVRDLFDRTLHP
ncbi:MAG TPA: protealysin inhibitor emfourin [Marmoricola sp.]|nr:protealysin inhibitor emfourin [Marmoricola sp.]